MILTGKAKKEAQAKVKAWKARQKTINPKAAAQGYARANKSLTKQYGKNWAK